MMLLAHQGGWDEALLVSGPLLAIVGLLWLAKRRADKLPQSSSASPAASASSSAPDVPPSDGIPRP